MSGIRYCACCGKRQDLKDLGVPIEMFGDEVCKCTEEEVVKYLEEEVFHFSKPSKKNDDLIADLREEVSRLKDENSRLTTLVEKLNFQLNENTKLMQEATTVQNKLENNLKGGK